MDTRTAEQRSRIMKSVGTSHTGPELLVRRILHGMGYRFRLHRSDLPGKPDIVLPRFKIAIFVHGCFWHGHRCKKGRAPKSRQEYWLPKLAANCARDKRQLKAIRALGWSALTVWQCETKDPVALARSLKSSLPKSTRG